MNSSLKKIGILILAVIILPVVVFSVFEIGNLRQNEKVIQDIYKNQLDAILFSINQYSNDIVSNLSVRIENTLNKDSVDAGAEMAGILNEVPAIVGILQFNTDLGYLSSHPDSIPGARMLASVTSMLKSNEKTLKQLQTYMRGGYRKIATIGKGEGNIQLIVFYTMISDREILNVLLLDPEKFISRILDPKIQEIAKDKFYIVAFRPGEDLPFYISSKQYNPGKIENKAPFWLLQDYLMGIELKDITIADLAKERTRRNLILVVLMDLVLISGTWLIFRNVRRQVELSQMKSDFVSSVSHEIRTPLALISMYIETLEMGRVKEESKVKEYYNVILNETSRLSGMVNRILSFSQIESNKRKYSFSEVEINEVVEKSALTFRYSLDSKGFVFSCEHGNDLPVIMADREAIADAFVNLVDNAIKYSGERKEIFVRTGRNDNYVYVEVEDHGIGIPEKNQKYIFDKFYRVTETNLANKVKGSGLGLAIVKHIMDIHKGSVYVRSTPGEGSLFRLSFPINKI
jgi:two-component system, OmpR family, phosphate regulon sensor histidine kinase PhoR